MRPTQAREKDAWDQKLAHDQQDDPHPGGPDDAAQLLGGRQVLGGVQIEGVEHDDPHQRGEGDDDGFTGRHELARIAQGVGGQQGHHHAEGVREGEPHGDPAVAAQRGTAGRDRRRPGCGMEPGLACPGPQELLGGAGTVVVEALVPKCRECMPATTPRPKRWRRCHRARRSSATHDPVDTSPLARYLVEPHAT